MSYEKFDATTIQVKNMLYSHRKLNWKRKITNSIFRNSCDLCEKMNSLYSDMGIPMRTQRFKIQIKGYFYDIEYYQIICMIATN